MKLADEEEEGFESLWVAGMEYAIKTPRREVFKQLAIAPRDMARGLAKWFQAVVEYPTKSQEPLVEQVVTDEAMLDALRSIVTDTGYTLFVVGMAFGLSAQGKMTVELPDEQVAKLLQEELSKRSGRLGQTKLVRNRRRGTGGPRGRGR